MKIKVYRSKISQKRYSNWKVEKLTRKQAENELDQQGLKITTQKLSHPGQKGNEFSEESVVGYCRIKNFKNIIVQLKSDKDLFTEYLNEFIRAVTGIVEMEGGEINKFSDDGILFYFRRGKTKKEYLNRAVLSSYKMRYRMNKLNRKWQTATDNPWIVGIGINKGNADFKIFEDSHTLFGELAETVKGLSNSAGSGEILISEKVYNDSEFDDSIFQMKEPKHVPIHGKGYVVKVKEIVGINKDVGLV